MESFPKDTLQHLQPARGGCLKPLLVLACLARKTTPKLQDEVVSNE